MIELNVSTGDADIVASFGRGFVLEAPKYKVDGFSSTDGNGSMTIGDAAVRITDMKSSIQNPRSTWEVNPDGKLLNGSGSMGTRMLEPVWTHCLEHSMGDGHPWTLMQTARTEDEHLALGVKGQVGATPEMFFTSSNGPVEEIVLAPSDKMEFTIKEPIPVKISGDNQAWNVRAALPNDNLFSACFDGKTLTTARECRYDSGGASLWGAHTTVHTADSFTWAGLLGTHAYQPDGLSLDVLIQLMQKYHANRDVIPNSDISARMGFVHISPNETRIAVQHGKLKGESSLCRSDTGIELRHVPGLWGRLIGKRERIDSAESSKLLSVDGILYGNQTVVLPEMGMLRSKLSDSPDNSAVALYSINLDNRRVLLTGLTSEKIAGIGIVDMRDPKSPDVMGQLIMQNV